MTVSNDQQRKPVRAFTLVEVMIATFVVAILFVALFAGLSQGFSLSTTARERLRANQIALERIEGLRLVKWNDLTNSVLVPVTFTTTYAPAGAAPGVQYSGTVSIDNIALSPAPSYSGDMKKITVNVSWTLGAITHTHSVATFVSRYGMQNYVYNN